MLGLLQAILCWIKQFGYMVLDAAIAAFNAVIAAIAAVLVALIGSIPVDMPEPPSLPQPFTTALQWIAWVFPVGTLVAIFAFVVTVWLFWMGLALVLRWAKAIDG